MTNRAIRLAIMWIADRYVDSIREKVVDSCQIRFREGTLFNAAHV